MYGDSKSRLSNETEDYLKEVIGTDNLSQHLDQLPVKDAKNRCKNLEDGSRFVWRMFLFINPNLGGRGGGLMCPGLRRLLAISHRIMLEI